MHVAGCGWVGLELLEPQTPGEAGTELDATAGELDEAGSTRDDAATSDDGAPPSSDAALSDAQLLEPEGGLPDSACEAEDAGGVCGCGVSPPPAYRHRYAFDETSGSTARDEVAGANAALVGFSGAAFRPAVLANGLDFDGVDDVASVGALPSALRTLTFYLSVDAYTLSQTVSVWAQPTSTGSPANQWRDPANAYARDGRFANFSALGFSQAQDYAGFAFALPSGAVVRGIEVMTTSQNTLGLTATFGVSLSWNGGGNFTARRDAPLLYTGDSTFGGASDTWGHAFTAAELGAPFRLRLESAGVPLLPLSQGVDALTARVHITPVALPRVVMVLAANVRVELTEGGLSLVGFPAGSAIYVDGAPGSALGAGFHHVAIVTPSALTASALSFGGPSSQGASFDGVLDDVRIYDAALSASDVLTVFRSPACLP